MGKTKLTDLRMEYHSRILEKILGMRKSGEEPCYSNADSSSKASCALADIIAKKLQSTTGRRPCRKLPKEQTVGTIFAELTKKFLDSCFGRVQHLRPGSWIFSTSQESAGISKHYQYEHLAQLQRFLEEHSELKATLGGDYLVTPDITVARRPVTDEEINKSEKLVSTQIPLATHTPLREAVNETSILHASISCKWTIRSDRAQNTRTEALNLLRNRKGKSPIVVAVTMEPLPTRIASIALGTGDLDCVYHAALPELQAAVLTIENEDQREMLSTLVNGRRLRDISDLPFDLAT